MSKLTNFTLLILTLFLAACAQTPSTDSTSRSRPQLDKSLIKNWQVRAKLGIRTAENSGSVTLLWQQNGDDYSIQILSPLGQSKALINGSLNNIVIEQPGKPTLFSNQPVALIEETFGWSIPLNNFKFWILGTQNPDSPVVSSIFNAQGELEKLEQSTWVLDYSRYQDIEGHLLPAKIRASQSSTRLTMLIREWQLL